MIQHDKEWSTPNLWNMAKTIGFLNTVFSSAFLSKTAFNNIYIM